MSASKTRQLQSTHHIILKLDTKPLIMSVSESSVCYYVCKGLSVNGCIQICGEKRVLFLERLGSYHKNKSIYHFALIDTFPIDV